MFTGLVREVGTVRAVRRSGKGAVIEISCGGFGEGVRLGDSIAVNGVCLSAVALGRTLKFDVVDNTWARTNLKRLTTGSEVNLEKALRVGDEVGGHFVTGHVDGERKVAFNGIKGQSRHLEVALDDGDMSMVAPRGSVAIDGISLTIGEVSSGVMKVFIIPHTADNTTIASRKKGDLVNVEFDQAARYGDREQRGIPGSVREGNKPSGLSRGKLGEHGFL